MLSEIKNYQNRFLRKKLNLFLFQTENIVLMGEFPNCDIKLCDLEVARVIQPGESITEWIGTLDYMGK